MAPKRARSGEGAANTNEQKRAGAAAEWRKKAPNIALALEMFLLVSRAREGKQNSAKINKKLTDIPKNRSKRANGRRAGGRAAACAEADEGQGEGGKGQTPKRAEGRAKANARHSPKRARRGEGAAAARPPARLYTERSFP